MKHLFTLLLSATLFLMCDPPLYKNGMDWYLKNTTERVIGISYAQIRNLESSKIELVAPEDSVRIGPHVISFTWDRMPKFEDLIEDMDGFRIVRLYDEDGTLLRTLDYSTDKDKHGEHDFFKESSWRKYVILDNVNYSTGQIKWIYDIGNDDLTDSE